MASRQTCGVPGSCSMPWCALPDLLFITTLPWLQQQAPAAIPGYPQAASRSSDGLLVLRSSRLQLFCRYPFDAREGEATDNRSIVQRIIAGDPLSLHFLRVGENYCLKEVSMALLESVSLLLLFSRLHFSCWRLHIIQQHDSGLLHAQMVWQADTQSLCKAGCDTGGTSLAVFPAVDYDFPTDRPVSDSVKSLLGRMLVADASQRATLLEIEQHPWFRKDMPPDLDVGTFNASYLRLSDSVEHANSIRRCGPGSLKTRFCARAHGLRLIQTCLTCTCQTWSCVERVILLAAFSLPTGWHVAAMSGTHGGKGWYRGEGPHVSWPDFEP